MGPTSDLRNVTCHMGSHSFSCHPTQVKAPRLNPSANKPVLNLMLFTSKGWKAESTRYPAMHRPGTELVISRSQVRRPNDYSTEPPNVYAFKYVDAWQSGTVFFLREPPYTGMRNASRRLHGTVDTSK